MVYEYSNIRIPTNENNILYFVLIFVYLYSNSLSLYYFNYKNLPVLQHMNGIIIYVFVYGTFLVHQVERLMASVTTGFIGVCGRPFPTTLAALRKTVERPFFHSHTLAPLESCL